MCVWPILLTAVVFFSYTPAIAGITIAGFALNWALILSALYAGYYVYLERPVGVIAAAMVVASFLAATYFHAHEDELFGMPAWKPALVVHVVSWLAQFYGHGAHEGRSPALIDNLWQAVTMAPLFVLLEVCFKFGYRPDFQKRVQAEIAKSLKEWKESKAKKAK